MKSFKEFKDKLYHQTNKTRQNLAHKLPVPIRNAFAAAYATGYIHNPDRKEDHERLRKFRKQLLTHKVPRIKTYK